MGYHGLHMRASYGNYDRDYGETMKLCACGCGKEVKTETATYLKGHYQKLKNKNQKTTVQPAIQPQKPQEKKQPSIWWQYLLVILSFIIAGICQYLLFTNIIKLAFIQLIIVYIIDFILMCVCLFWVWRNKKRHEIIKIDNPEQFLEEIPRWSISEANPKSGIGAIINSGRQYKQLVFVSKNFEPRSLWAEWNGFLFIINNRGYNPGQDIIGDVWFYDVDSKTPLIDRIESTREDAEDSFQLAAVWNQGVAVGHASALSETQSHIKIILILCGVICVMVLLFAIYSIGQFDILNQKMNAIIQIAQEAREIATTATQGK